jgi:RNA polymerase sigma factor (sigma-70 family)
MSDSILDSGGLQEYLDRWQAGDRAAADDLLRKVRVRLEKLAKRMLRTFPNVRCFADSDDVLQNSLVRLLRTLQQLKPKTTRDFYNLAAVHIRRELLDLARSARGKGTVSLNTSCQHPHHAPEPACPETAEADLWVQFHQAIDRLPVEEREVVGLIFYHGWTQNRIAELFQVDERTIRRRWSAACERLKTMIGSDFFEK